MKRLVARFGNEAVLNLAADDLHQLDNEELVDPSDANAAKKRNSGPIEPQPDDVIFELEVIVDRAYASRVQEIIRSRGGRIMSQPDLSAANWRHGGPRSILVNQNKKS